MHCPSCRAEDTKVIDSREADEGAAIRRRRSCPQCSHRFTTFERLEELPLMVVKTHGGREPFDRNKVLSGIRAACKGRPVSADQMVAIAESVEDELRMSGTEVTSAQIGVVVLDRLRDLDAVAYLRFASVYKNFDEAGDFVEELQLMQKQQATGVVAP